MYIERYRRGEREHVWRELVALGNDVRKPETLSDARAVACETMIRVKRNAEVLVNNLLEAGYDFARPDWVLVPPAGEVTRTIERIETQIGGPIPLSLQAFYEIVGRVDLRGTPPAEWRGCEYPDPLVVFGVDALEYGVEISMPYVLAGGDEIHARIAPDHITKEDVSGGVYDMVVPNADADGLIVGDWCWHDHSHFVSFLRVFFQWGGFARLGRVRSGLTWPLDQLREGLVEI